MKIEEMIAANRADCSGCEACANICPKNALTMTRDAEGFAYPKINPKLCIKCGRCDSTCPALNFTAKTIDDFPPTFVAAYQNNKILRHSSSGGVFTALSEIILRGGGIVFGAGFDKNWRVIHTSAKNLDELENLRGSKYVQSKIGDVYQQVKESLKSGSVLFSGTPCQCAGLKNFLGKDYDNLLTVEIICHGVPSPALWESYIDELGYAHEIKHINFRSKRNGWSSTIDINFADQGNIISANSKNIYGKLFLDAISERPSCQSCKFKFPNGQSDLTLGDAWGIKDFAPEMYDKRGVSIVFVHTAKGKDFFEKTNLKIQKVKFIDSIKKNPYFISPKTADSRRKEFFAELVKSDDWFFIMQKYFAQDDEELIKDTNKKSRITFRNNLQKIFSMIRQKFEQNILVISTPREKEEQNLLSNFFEQSFKNCGIYILQPKEEGQLVCTETFSQIASELNDSNALSDFVNQYNITKIYVEKPLNFGDSLSVIRKWLKSCGLLVKFFAQNPK